MKKIIALALALVLALSLGTAALADDTVTLKVGASPTPHAVILEYAAELLADQNIKLDIVEYSDYVQPNLAVESGDLDANYFQHTPYLNTFNDEYDTHLVSVGMVHYEPFGIYPGATATLEELEDGATIAIPNDGSNETRALLLLQQEGLLTLKEGIDASSNATKLDIEDNPHNFEITEMEAAQLPLVLEDVDLAVINGNYALDADLHAGTDALAVEDASGDGALTYANILCVKEGNEDNEAIQALLAVLQSDEIAQFIYQNFDGAVVPITGKVDPFIFTADGIVAGYIWDSDALNELLVGESWDGEEPQAAYVFSQDGVSYAFAADADGNLLWKTGDQEGWTLSTAALADLEALIEA